MNRAILSLIIIASHCVAAPPQNFLPPPSPLVPHETALKRATVVLRVTFVSETTEANGTRWQTAKIREVIKNRSKHQFADEVSVAVIPGRSRAGLRDVTSGRPGMWEAGKEWIIYLSRSTASRDDLWVLTTADHR